jgi:hypothetical protein
METMINFTDKEIKIDMCADDCKALILQTMAHHKIDLDGDTDAVDAVLLKIKKWIDYVLSYEEENEQ